MENIKNEKKVENKVDTKVSKIENTGIDLSLLNILDEEEAEQNEFIHTDITMKITSYKMNPDNQYKAQLQSKVVNEEGNIEEQTFSVNSENVIKEEDISKYVDKTIKAINVERYVKAIKDHNETIIGEEVRYGAELETIKIVEDIEVAIIVNDYVEVELTAVANKMKKDKATGEVILNSITKDGTSLKTFTCVFSNKEIAKEKNNFKLERNMFSGLIGKKIRINNLEIRRFRGDKLYTTYTMIELAK